MKIQLKNFKKNFYSLFFLFVLTFFQNTSAATIGAGIPPLLGLLKKTVPENLISEFFLLIPPGQDPHTYEPTPHQIQSLSQIKIYFTLNLAQEKAWLNKIKKNNPLLKIVDITQKIPKKTISGTQDHHHSNSHKHTHEEDPHYWNNPLYALTMIQTAVPYLKELYPQHAREIQSNAELLYKNLQNLNTELTKKLSPLTQKSFMVFHPAWVYFAEQYGLKEIAIETNGKEAGPKLLAQLTTLAQKEKIKIIFIQKQFSLKQAETIAHAIGAHMEYIDDLDENYLENLKNIGDLIFKANSKI